MIATKLLSIWEITASLILLWATFNITTAAGISTNYARWALFRRALYSITAVALFAMGIHRVQDAGVDSAEVLYQSIIVGSIIVFPVLRAFRLISQDTLNVFQGFPSSSGSKRVRP